MSNAIHSSLPFYPYKYVKSFIKKTHSKSVSFKLGFVMKSESSRKDIHDHTEHDDIYDVFSIDSDEYPNLCRSCTARPFLEASVENNGNNGRDSDDKDGGDVGVDLDDAEGQIDKLVNMIFRSSSSEVDDDTKGAKKPSDDVQDDSDDDDPYYHDSYTKFLQGSSKRESSKKAKTPLERLSVLIRDKSHYKI